MKRGEMMSKRVDNKNEESKRKEDRSRIQKKCRWLVRTLRASILCNNKERRSGSLIPSPYRILYSEGLKVYDTGRRYREF